VTGRTRSPERRQITVLLCDVVGYSSLAQRVDAEELADLIVTYRRHCATSVARHEGTVAQYIGDGVVAFFGYPDAHEDDAERAIRSALEIVSGDARMSPLVKVRIGVATGPVVIGDLLEDLSPSVSRDPAGHRSHISAVGESPNLAARLQTLAEPGTVVVSEQTRRLCRGVFEYQDLGRHELKGFAEPIQAWQVLRESRVESRFHALRAADLTPLVNRRAELEEITRLWQAAKAGHGSTLLVSGEAGIGKSRLANEVAGRLTLDGALRIRYSCSSSLKSSPLAPLVRHLPRAAGFADEDDDRAKVQKLERLATAAALDPSEVVPLIATLLSIGYEACYAPLVLSPHRQRQRLFEVLVDLLRAAASRRPILLVVEDLHWIDPSSDELLRMVVEATTQIPVLTIVTTRNEIPDHWRHRTHVSEMRLLTLDRSDSLTMIDWLCRGQAVPEGAMTAIADRADGLPLFIEDLTKDILEMSAVQAPGDLMRTHGQRLDIPDTLKDTLMSRLDRLGPAKQAAQIGAVIGREFSYPLLSRVADRSEEELNDQIQRLVGSGLVAERRSAGAASYEFKHALVRDAAYASLLNKERIALHARIADVLVGTFPETVNKQPEILAYHLQSAGEIQRAIALWVSAAKLSARRSGFVEAIAQLEEALRLCTGQAPTPDRLRLELRVHLALGGIYAEHMGFSSAECGGAYTRALELCRQLGDAPQIVSALSGLGSFEITRGNLPRSRALGEECLRLAGQQTSKPPYVMGHLLLGGTLFLSGQFAPARSHLEEAIRLYEEDRPSRKGKQVLYVQDQKATGMCYLGIGLTIMGHLDAGLAAAREGVHHARALGAIHAMNFSLCYLAGVYYFRRDAADSLQFATESLELAREQGFATWRGASQIMRGDALMRLGSIGEGFAEIEAGVNAHSDIDAISYRTVFSGILVRGLLTTGRLDEALEAVEEGIATSEQRDERFYVAELLRLKGETLAKKGRPLEAEYWLREAIAVAERQEAKLFQLRGTVSLCRLLPAERAATAVRERLAPICRWFPADAVAPDLTEARTLLAATPEARITGYTGESSPTSCTN
jgi:class 3 adenylate cyclase/tetratricopeptide (TPR) repeat protein